MLRHLRRQTIRDELELVVPTPNADLVRRALTGDELAVNVVEIEAISPISAARAAGVRAARTPFVFLGETHSFPEPDMLERLVECHRAGWDRVAPVFGNANPKTVFSWAAFLLDYGAYGEPAPPGEGDVPIYNCSYRRSMLLEFGPALDALLESGSTLNVDLQNRRFRSHREAAARITHVNVATARSFVRQRYLIGRNIATRRSRRWTTPRRVLYVAGSPLIPPLLALRALRSRAMRERVRAAPRYTFVAMLAALVVRGVGEAIGYAAGTNGCAEELDDMEIHKLRYA